MLFRSPLIHITADRTKMGALVSPRWLTLIAVIIAVVIIALNVKLVFDFVTAL